MGSTCKVSLKEELYGLILFWPLIKRLAFVEISSQYKGAAIGVFWGVIAFFLKVLILTIVYSKVMSKPVGEYLPYLATGVLTWQYLSSMVMEGGVFFTKNKAYLLQFKRPFSIFVGVGVLKNASLFWFNFCLMLPVIFYYCGFSFLGCVWFFLGFSMLSVLGVLCYYVLGFLCLMFPDVRHMMQSIMTIGFVVTPVLWSSESLEGSWVLLANPFYHFLNVLREPILSHTLPLLSFSITCVFLFFGALFSLYVLNRYGRKVLLWV